MGVLKLGTLKSRDEYEFTHEMEVESAPSTGFKTAGDALRAMANFLDQAEEKPAENAHVYVWKGGFSGTWYARVRWKHG